MLNSLLLSLALSLLSHKFFNPVNATPQSHKDGSEPASVMPSTSPANNNGTGLPASGSSSDLLTAWVSLQGSSIVNGRVQFSLQAGSNSVAVNISINGLNLYNSTGSYAYHIHTNPISSDGNCSSALGHLDPLNVTDSLVCNPLFPQYCEEGDLSGRHGKLNGSQPTLNVSYTDDYLRFWTQPFTLLGRSIVLHAPNSTRIACGNITSTVDGTATADGAPTFQSSNYTTKYPARAPPSSETKYEPFNGSTPNPAVISQIYLPFPLPSVLTSPNIILGENKTEKSADGKKDSITLPAAFNASTPFTYTPGAALPSQNDTSDKSTGSDASKKASSSGTNHLAPPQMLVLMVATSLLIFA